MFDIGFSELLIIGVIALIVIGPERLPKVARLAGQWLGRLNRYVSQVKQEIDRDMRLEELRKMQQDMKESAQKYELMANETAHRVQEEVTEEAGQISKAMQPLGAAAEDVVKQASAKPMPDAGVAEAAGHAPAAQPGPDQAAPANAPAIPTASGDEKPLP
jgi:sec-independent protein translocase protein TatB